MVYLQIILKISPTDRPAAAAIYTQYKEQFLKQITGARSKELLIREDDVQVLHGFSGKDEALAYLESSMFSQDVVTALKPLLQAAPDVRVYTVA